MITLQEFYSGRDKTHAAELTDEIKGNAFITVTRVNLIMNAVGMNRRVTSGWRPQTINAITPGAAKKSNHIIGAACDLEDRDGKLYDCLYSGHDHDKDTGPLADIGLWVEIKRPSWVHLQIFAPKSGKRFFKP